MHKKLDFRSQEAPYVQDPPSRSGQRSLEYVLRGTQQIPAQNSKTDSLRRILQSSGSQDVAGASQMSFLDDLSSTEHDIDTPINAIDVLSPPGDNPITDQDNREQEPEKEATKSNQRERFSYSSELVEENILVHYRKAADTTDKSSSEESLIDILSSDELPIAVNEEVNSVPQTKSTTKEIVNSERCFSQNLLSETPALIFEFPEGAASSSTTNQPIESVTSSTPRLTKTQGDKELLKESNISVESPPEMEINDIQESPKHPEETTNSHTSTQTADVPMKITVSDAKWVPAKEYFQNRTLTQKDNTENVPRTVEQRMKDQIKLLSSLRLISGREESFEQLKLKYPSISSDAWKLLESMLKRPREQTRIQLPKELDGLGSSASTPALAAQTPSTESVTNHPMKIGKRFSTANVSMDRSLNDSGESTESTIDSMDTIIYVPLTKKPQMEEVIELSDTSDLFTPSPPTAEETNRIEDEDTNSKNETTPSKSKAAPENVPSDNPPPFEASQAEDDDEIPPFEASQSSSTLYEDDEIPPFESSP